MTEAELEHIISKSPTKSCSLDPMPTWMVKGVLGSLTPLMTQLVNQSLLSGIVPDSIKIARVSPLLKKASLDSEELKNYRPVSNLSFISKILEKVVASRLRQHMDYHGLHDPMQSAYKAGHSTESALTKVQNDLLRAMDQQGVAILVLLDLSAAFDTIDHEVLLSRMCSFLGINGVALDWFRSYLTDRKQQVQIGGEMSTLKPLHFGVPQGSVLGPLLFLIYMLPLRHLVIAYGFNMHSFADDNQLYVFFMKPRDTIMVVAKCSALEKCLGDIERWMTINKLKLNSDKTEIKLFGTKHSLSCINIPSLNVAGTCVTITEGTIRNLGVMMDSLLSMSSLVGKMIQSACFHIRNIGTVRKMLTESSTKTLVHSLVMSRLDYGNSLLCGVPNELIQRLQRVQNKAARLVTLISGRAHITPVLKSLHWLPITARVQYKVLLLVYKALAGLAPQYIRELIPEHQPVRQLRSSIQGLLKVPRSKLITVGDRAFSIYAPKA